MAGPVVFYPLRGCSLILHARPAESDQPANPRNLVWVFAVRSMNSWEPSYLLSARSGLLSGCADEQADLSLRLPHTCVLWELFCPG